MTCCLLANTTLSSFLSSLPLRSLNLRHASLFRLYDLLALKIRVHHRFDGLPAGKVALTVNPEDLETKDCRKGNYISKHSIDA